MASSRNRNTSRAEGAEVPATPLGNVHVSACSSSLKYRLYPIEIIFPPFDEPWISEGYLPPKEIAAGFGQATNYSITITDISLTGVREKYLITDEHVLLCPGPGERASSAPLGCYSIYEEHLKSGYYKEIIDRYPVQFQIWESNEYMFYLAIATLAFETSGAPKLSVVTQSRIAVSTSTGGMKNQRKNVVDPVIEGVPFMGVLCLFFKRKRANTTRPDSDDICDLLGEDPSVQAGEGTEDEDGMSPIWEGKSVNLPYKDGPVLNIDDPFFDKYPISELDMGGEEVLFHLDWNLNVKDRTIDFACLCEDVGSHSLVTMIFSHELLFCSQTAMLGASAVANEKIKRLEEEVHELKLHKGEVMNIKSSMMRERDGSQKHVYELETELKELKSNFTVLDKCQREIPLIGLAMKEMYRSLFSRGARIGAVLY
ncbi:hypothetical protein M9H77_12545 [Catharanthus roseus]|uniref:Uncharacterized protein n=1 Tax=Catharanthus roseus TaxID=4058 RepID=A0ACC0BHN4_CATRO|nr:hypothetical protein M9H77_12545 [Catharanthus roseus]